MPTVQHVRTQLRRRLHGRAQRTYWLVEFDASGAASREAFTAPSDAEALERALDVVEGEAFTLLEGERLVRQWTMAEDEGRSFAPR